MTPVARLTLAPSALTFALSGGAAQAASPSRADDPVVLTGADLPALGGTVPDRIVAFSWQGGWKQVPVQIDERALVDLRNLCNGAGGSTPINVLSYTDPGTFAGPDPDPSFDGNDEVATMSGDGRSKAATPKDPAGVVSGSGVEVRGR